MNWIKQLLSRRRIYSDLSEEIQEHLEEKIDELVASGASREEATYAARREFGNATLIEERGREVWSWSWLETLGQDVRYGFRQLRRNPGFTIIAVLTLALGIGANTAIFSVVNAVVLRPLPYSHSDRLVWIAESIPALKSEAATGGDYVDWKDQNHTLDRIAAYDTVYRDSLREGSGSGGGSADFNLTGRGTPARVHGAFVSASFFATLGVEPQLGRAFTENEDQPSGPHVVVLMHSFWQQYFGSDAHVLGQTVNLDAAPYTVIGVMPASFRFPGDSDAQILVPLALNQASERLRIAQRHVRIIGRLKPGVSLAAARADLDEIRKRVGVVGNTRHEGLSEDTEAEFYVPYLQSPGNSMQLAVLTATEPDSMVSAVRAQVRDVDPDQPLYHVATLQQVLSESLAPRRFNMLLLGIFAGIALTLATVGIYGVMAFSVTQRTHEIGIRMALGAERGNVLRLIVRQGLRLTLFGVVLGVAGAWALASFLASFQFGVAPRDPATFVLVSLALVAVSILACYIPARRATRVDPMVALRYE